MTTTRECVAILLLRQPMRAILGEHAQESRRSTNTLRLRSTACAAHGFIVVCPALTNHFLPTTLQAGVHGPLGRHHAHRPRPGRLLRRCAQRLGVPAQLQVGVLCCAKLCGYNPLGQQPPSLACGGVNEHAGPPALANLSATFFPVFFYRAIVDGLGGVLFQYPFRQAAGRVGGLSHPFPRGVDLAMQPARNGMRLRLATCLWPSHRAARCSVTHT